MSALLNWYDLMTVFLSTTLLWLPAWTTVNYINLSHSGVEVIQTTLSSETQGHIRAKLSQIQAQKVLSHVRREDHLLSEL